MMKDNFLREMKKKKYFAAHQKVLVAVSGGLDSMTLFDWLYCCRKELGIELALAHVNHQQRPESDFEEEELKKMASQLDVKFFASSFSGPFSEQKARQFRYQFFENIMQDYGYTALVTAHHSDDQAETVFMRLLRGSRLRHLTGIKDRQPFAGGELIRPLLSFSKSDFPEILHFEDRSNLENRYLRNRIRNQYLPLLEQENPQLKEALLHIRSEAETWKEALQYLTEDLDIRDLSVFYGQIPQLQSFLLEEYLQQFPDLKLSGQQFAEVLNILRTKSNYIHPLKGDYELFKDYESFEIRKISRKPDLKVDSILLEFNNLIQFGNYRFSFGQPLDGENTMEIPVSDQAAIRLRYRRPGDSILLNHHHKKVRRLFIDRKIPFSQRKTAVIVEQNQQILAIPTIAVSDLSKGLKNDIMTTILYIQTLDR